MPAGAPEAEAERLAEIAARRAARRKKWHAEKRREARRKAKAAASTDATTFLRGGATGRFAPSATSPKGPREAAVVTDKEINGFLGTMRS